MCIRDRGLAEEGFVEGENLTILYENANADGGTSSQIITNFISKKADLICGCLLYTSMP